MGLDYGFPPARPGRGAPSMFPRKLYQILCETDPAIVGWDSDGESFHIANMDQFVEAVMPMYYRHNKLTSFQRQLNLYGFKKRSRDERNAGHYYHPFFQRDHPEILGDVRRSYPAGSSSSKSEDDEGDSSPGNTIHAFPQPSSSPRRKRVAPYPKRKAESPRPEVTGLRKKSPIEAQEQQAAKRTAEVVRNGRGGAGGAGEAVPYDSEPGNDVVRDESDRDGRDNFTTGKMPAERPWFYSGSPAVSDAYPKRVDPRGVAKVDGVEDDREGWRGNGRDGSGGMGGGGGRATYLREPGKGGSGAGETFARRPFPYKPMNGRQWGAYRDQEESCSAAGGGWYDSEESGLSRLPSCDSGSSTWDDMQPPGGLEFFDRNRARAMAASTLVGGTEARRYRQPVEGVGTAGRPTSMGPAHRAVPTSAMFPAQFLRHERFGSYPDFHYPPPPVFLPAHTNPDPDGPPPKASKWRPVYNGNRVESGGSGGAGGSGGGSGNGGRVGGGWGVPVRMPAGGRGAAGWNARNSATDSETAAVTGEAKVVVAAGEGEERARSSMSSRPHPVAAPQDTRSSNSSSYRAACDEFLSGDDEGTAESKGPAGFRFEVPIARSSVAGSGKGDAVGSRAFAMAAMM